MNIKEILGNWIVKNVLLAVAFVAAFVILASVLLSVGTQHNKVHEVPDFTNLTYSEARHLANASGLKVIITDSMYVRRLRPGAVYMQNPKAGSYVKKGRRIRLTTNTMVPKEVYMPSLVGCSLKQAKAELQRNGLALGRLIYVRDIATNNVLRQQRGGVDIAPGRPLSSGTTINLVLGLNPSESDTYVPKLIGKQYLNAVDMIQENSLNVGKLHFDDTVQSYADSVSAVVYSQRPSGTEGTVRMGTEVVLNLTTDHSKLPGSARK